MKKFRLLLICTFLSPFLLHAQNPSLPNASEIKLALKKLNVTGSVLYMAAHPDDENTRLLSYLAKERKLRTGYLSLTRGDGGQNLIGNEQGELLGLIRTQELLAARRMDGAEQFFTRANDFGFSKTSEETFKIWDKDQILADAVWVIRKFQPDIIITRFPEDARAGHGQHAASAIIAREAFIAAADPKRFPEQLKHVQTWKTKRLLWNTFNFGGTNTTSDDQLKLDVGVFNPLLGKSYGEIAAESRSNHKSQGFGAARQRGQSIEFFSMVAGDTPKTDLFDGIDLSWARIAGSENVGRMLVKAEQNFKMDDPAASVPELLAALDQVEKLPESNWKTQKQNELKELLAAAAGLWFEVQSVTSSASVGQTFGIKKQAIINSDVKVSWHSQPGSQPEELKKGVLNTRTDSARVNDISQPYWLMGKHPNGMYPIPDEKLVGTPENKAALVSTFSFLINGKLISFERPAIYKYTDPVKGEIYQPLAVTPPVTVSIPEQAYVFTGNSSRRVAVQVKAFTDDLKAVVKPVVPAGWKISPQKMDVHLTKKGDEQTIEFTITPSGNINSGTLTMNVEAGGKLYNRGIKVLAYNHIPMQTLFPLSEARLERLDLKSDGKKVGYIAGAGDIIPESLRQVGYDVINLTESDVLNGNLAGFDAIIAGVRAYNVNDRIKFMQARLMDYVKNGGTYLVQYNTSTPLQLTDIGPYPFKISRDRVTEEDARVTISKPGLDVLNYPNKITGTDFGGWVQERGVYFVSEKDPKYQSVLTMNDQNEAPSEGSLIIADYGKGRFVYTSLAFFRQLPAGVPGAYRLFINLIAKKK